MCAGAQVFFVWFITIFCVPIRSKPNVLSDSHPFLLAVKVNGIGALGSRRVVVYFRFLEPAHSRTSVQWSQEGKNTFRSELHQQLQLTKRKHLPSKKNSNPSYSKDSNIKKKKPLFSTPWLGLRRPLVDSSERPSRIQEAKLTVRLDLALSLRSTYLHTHIYIYNIRKHYI